MPLFMRGFLFFLPDQIHIDRKMVGIPAGIAATGIGSKRIALVPSLLGNEIGRVEYPGLPKPISGTAGSTKDRVKKIWSKRFQLSR